eukprot:9499445-Pyramimonas_sp.AAC.1
MSAANDAVAGCSFVGLFMRVVLIQGIGAVWRACFSLRLELVADGVQVLGMGAEAQVVELGRGTGS